MRRLAVLASLTAAAAFAQSYPAAWNLVHPDAKALVGIDMRVIRESALVKEIGNQFPFHVAGLLDDIDHVLISSPGPAPGSKQAENAGLVIITGRFSGGRKPMKDMVKLDEHTLVGGDPVSVKEAVTRFHAVNRAPAPLLARGAALAAEYDLWAIATLPPGVFEPAASSFGKSLAEIKGFEMGLKLRERLDLEISLATSSGDSAAALVREISNLVQAATPEIAQRLQSAIDGKSVRFHLSMEQDELTRTLRSRGESVRHEPAPQGRPKTIRIYGLDEGVREIPFPSGRN